MFGALNLVSSSYVSTYIRIICLLAMTVLVAENLAEKFLCATGVMTKLNMVWVIWGIPV